MPTVSASEFQWKFHRFWHEAPRDPAEIPWHGRRKFVFMPAEHHGWLRASTQRTHRVDDAVNVVINAVARAEMHIQPEPLDDLLT